MKASSLLGVAAAAAAMIAASGVANANLVVNGGFETGDLTGWTQSGNTAFMGVSDFNPHSGTYSAFAGPVGPRGFLSQTLTTTVGAGYTISFWLYNDGGDPNEFDIEWNAATLYDETNLPGFPYTQYTFEVIGTGSDMLTLGFMQEPGYLYLDDVDVSVTAVPEPGSLALLGAALAGFGITRGRRRRTARRIGS